MALSTVVELANYRLRVIDMLTIFFQFGVLFFIVTLGIASGYYVRESMQNAGEKQRQTYEMENMEKQLALQRLQYHKMAEDEEWLKSQRHDFRHHLAVLRSLTAKEKISMREKELAFHQLWPWPKNIMGVPGLNMRVISSKPRCIYGLDNN